MPRIEPYELRHIHLDFHTPGFVEVADQFDAGEFFDTLEQSRVNSLAFFAKCHHGYSYFDTQVGTRHPGMCRDMFGEAAREAQRRGIAFMAYFSLNVDEIIADQHPEWVALHPDGSPVNSQILQDGSELYWRWLCPNRGPYFDDFFFPHVEECLAKYPIDGLFIDMAGYLPESCFCDNCIRLMQEQGLDPYDPIDHTEFISAQMQHFARRLRSVMDGVRPEMRLQIGCFNAWGEPAKAPGVISEFYVESLAFQTGWFNFPVMGRYLSNIGLPVMGMTGRFLKNWGDFGTVVSEHQLKMQLASHLSIGASCCVGDHMHPSGRLEPAVYKVIGEAFKFVKERQPYCSGMQRMQEVALFVPGGVESNTAVAAKGGSAVNIWDSVYGYAKLMMEGHYQWDVLGPESDLTGISCAVLTHSHLNSDYITVLEQFVDAGGVLVVDAGAILVDSEFAARWQSFIGIEQVQESNHTGAFYRITDPELAAGIPEMAHYVHAHCVDVTAAPDALQLSHVFYSPSVRSRESFYGHFHGPDTEPGGAGISSVRRGQGRVVVLAQPLSVAYLNTGYHVHRRLMHNLLDSVLPEKIIITNAPSIMEITVGTKDNSLVLQFLAFISDRRHRYSFESLNEPIAIQDVEVSLRTDKCIGRLHNPIDGMDIQFERTSEGIRFTAPSVADHLVLVADFDDALEDA